MSSRGAIVLSVSRTRQLVVSPFVALVLVLAGCGSSPHAPTATPTIPGQPGSPGELEWNGQTWVPIPPCAWPTAVNADVISENNEFNNSNPDVASAYRILFFTVQDGLQITLSGRYPNARYMSFEVYNAHGAPFSTNGVTSALTDDQITPDRGSVNPWQHKARPGGRFTLTLRSDLAPGEANTLPLAPAGTAPGTTGVIFFRVYVPAHGDPWAVPLPTVTFTRHGVSTKLPPCPARTSSVPADPVLRAAVVPAATGPTSRPAAPSASGLILAFARHPPAGPGRTPDSNEGYLSAVVIPPDTGDVVVIRARAPSWPEDAGPAPWPVPGADTRYWSLCIDLVASRQPVVVNHLPGGKVDLSCRYDSQVRLDQHGDYTFVVGTEAQRTAIERTPGATFLALSRTVPDQPYVLFLRNLLASPGFDQAIQNVPADGKPASASAVMGAYYPRIGFCSLQTLSRRGPNACLPSSS